MLSAGGMAAIKEGVHKRKIEKPGGKERSRLTSNENGFPLQIRASSEKVRASETKGVAIKLRRR